MRRRETIPVLCSCVLPIAATATCCLTAGEDSHPLYSGVESNWRLQANRATADSTTDDTNNRVCRSTRKRFRRRRRVRRDAAPR
ncbi:hypothetical protein PF010_g31710 [Phytophthora fragariae]|uniref:RxLR effector protein n=1 Tax=Phytophthora fragariae TaxID=53985 RepID=A0A6G0JHI2_9STRA|nr:hypothetical protein PF010_g31710 [Phytophthora fragariae]KAE9229860.1 hypothetical protein PF004_g10658 [Phytophthora fragariae]